MKRTWMALLLASLVLAACTLVTAPTLTPQPTAATDTGPSHTSPATPRNTTTPIEMQVPAATVTSAPGPAATPDIAATVVALQRPEVYGTYPSPDGKWRAEVVVYECTRVDQEGEFAHEQLKLVHIPSGEERTVDTQLISCGGLGAFGLAGLFWSPNSRYFYYTDAREGVPDGCGYWERPVTRLDLTALHKETLGGAYRSPDGRKIAAWQERELVIWEVNGSEAARFPAMAQVNIGPVAWSPDSQALVYLQLDSFCPVSGKSYLVHVDLLSLQQTLLLESEEPTFSSVVWSAPDVLNLFDENGRQWIYTLSARQLTP